MRELFEAIDNCEAGSVNMVLTVLDGEYLGEKALVSDGKLIWESNEEGFFSKYEEAVCQMQDSGVVTIGDSRVFCDTLGQEKTAGHLWRRSCVNARDQNWYNDGLGSNRTGRQAQICRQCQKSRGKSCDL